jgi:hypothetical protein
MTARTIGRANRARGVALEDALEAQHGLYRAEGRAFMTRVPTPVTVIGRTTVDARGRACFRACFAARTGVDFVGYIGAGIGTPVALEAKTHAGADAWDSGLDPGTGHGVGGGGMTREQSEQLDAYDMHGHAYVILSAWGAVWRIDFHDLARHVYKARRRTVRPGEVESIGRRLVGVDWIRESEA